MWPALLIKNISLYKHKVVDLIQMQIFIRNVFFGM